MMQETTAVVTVVIVCEGGTTIFMEECNMFIRMSSDPDQQSRVDLLAVGIAFLNAYLMIFSILSLIAIVLCLCLVPIV